MMKKPPVSRLSRSKTETRGLRDTWHNGGDAEILRYSRSLQKAAGTLVEKLDLDQNAETEWDTCPVVLLYRQALEIHLKFLVGEGSNFLRTRIDPISLAGTHSLRWLGQIVCQIIRAVGWESDFICEGVSSLAEFSALVNEVEAFDPVARAIRLGAKDPAAVSAYYRAFDVGQFAEKLDGLLDLLDVTADALAAMWDQREEFDGGDDSKPTIQ
jgi:hypothetical protein